MPNRQVEELTVKQSNITNSIFNEDALTAQGPVTIITQNDPNTYLLLYQVE